MTSADFKPLGNRERQILDILVQMHGEFGLDKQFTAAAVEQVADGPCPGSLAGLAMKGYVVQQASVDGIVYAVTEQGYALFAGIEGQV